jgi:outer membrane lipoprotein carrier protein
MKRYFRHIAAIGFLAFLFALTAWAQTDVHQIAERVDHHYNSLQSLEAQFVETYAGNGLQRTESGTLYLKKPGKMRWDYRQPRPKVFVSDGKTAWFYVPGERQAQKAPVKKLDDLRSPIAYMLGKTKLEKEFKALSLAPDVTPIAPGDVVLRGIPKNMEERVSQVLLEVTPEGRLARIVIDEVDGAKTEFRFSSQKENVGIAEQRFHFSPPPGVETVDMDQIGL